MRGVAERARAANSWGDKVWGRRDGGMLARSQSTSHSGKAFAKVLRRREKADRNIASKFGGGGDASGRGSMRMKAESTFGTGQNDSRGTGNNISISQSDCATTLNRP